MKALLAIAAIILAAASFAGCSSGDDTGSTTGADNTTSQSTTDGGENSKQAEEKSSAEALAEIKAIACSLYKQEAEKKLSSAQKTLENQVAAFLTMEYPEMESSPSEAAPGWAEQIEALRSGNRGITLQRAIKEVC